MSDLTSDESTGKSVSDFLTDKGFDTVYVGNWEEGARDREIIEKAQKENRIIITIDKDFGKLVVKEDREAEGVVLLRLEIETPGNKVETIGNLLEKHDGKLPGNLVIVKEDSIKIREI